MDYMLIAVALLPAVALCIYVYKKDRVEKEPVGLLLKLLALGAVSCFPAAWIEGILDSVLYTVFSPFGEVSGGELILGSGMYTVYQAVSNFIGIALVEELCKYAVLYWVTFNNKNFNCTFDAMIYAVFVSLGFAALENVLYAFSYGMDTALVRAVTSVPAHMFFAVFMGYFYARGTRLRRIQEDQRNLVKAGALINKSKSLNAGKQLTLAVVIPTLVHGFYDFCLSLDSVFWCVFVFLAFLVVLYIYCFSKVQEASREDGGLYSYSFKVLTKLHPELLNDFNSPIVIRYYQDKVAVTPAAQSE